MWGYKAVNEAKLDIPEDISVVSFDDTEMARYMTPSLISIRMDVIRTSDGKSYQLL
ncbi:substrate-binding domain-containing protein [Jeotgalibaca arthritidis]|uniref:Substrate-binding domain-containing protein n=1 Tax=Jeotgalibaca arthritidis TaxID=1868794 RepID=A0A6G7K873_9LACT|nr:substrate-binding domain-containing protein [Jeotgalibaca arthritidis]QII81456.1 substrate-binding domain-containing protein [Jeotgalibaca arthritidis]